MQWDAIDISTFCYAAAVATAIFGIVSAYCSYKAWTSEKMRKKSRALQRNTAEGWAPTGRIDFAGGATTGNFVLRVEETQVVKGIGGTEYRDVRWRTPILEEVKAVVVAA
jgi:hypothetical protein